ncbi:hypothetical protein CRYUN_Cryun01aG0126800 [Craigia yunnanensis]
MFIHSTRCQLWRKGYVQTDLGTPLLKAWKQACASPTRAKIIIPKGTYRLSAATLEGPCKSPIELQVQGTITAPANPSSFKDPNWVVFNHVNGLTVSGGGVFDGQGAAAWGKNNCAKNKYCAALPINLRFNFVNNAMIEGIATKEGKQFHVNVLGCQNITFQRFTVSAPESSLNTDGIHIGRSNGVKILNSNIKTGDDCVSLGDGSKNVIVQGVTCGPGHGITVGSLGKWKGEEPVSGIFVRDCTISNTMNGGRIKTWPASHPGSASDMHFEGIIMNNVRNPILGDQEYCPWNQCNLKICYLSKSLSSEKGLFKLKFLLKSLFCLSRLHHVLNSAKLASRTFGALLQLGKLSNLFAAAVCHARVWNSPILTLPTKGLKDLQYPNVPM